MSEKYSKYELVSPGWLNEDFFTTILRKSENDNHIKVTSLKITPATVNNDHYGSVMYRTRIQYNGSKGKTTTVSLVVKTIPDTESIKKDLLEDTFVFKTEIRMFSETIPKMEAELRKYGDETVLGARVVYSALKPTPVIVFEDLKEKGFSTLPNREPTLEEIKRAMLKIAKWHAVSYKLAQEEPESIKTYNDGTFNLDMEKVEMFATGSKYFVEVLLSHDDELKKYIPYFEKLDKVALKRCSKMCNAYKNGEKALFVLNHGDFHSRNMMFSYKDTGEFNDLMLVDFQMCFYGPVVQDLMNAMYMLWDQDTRWNKREEMINDYFSNFIGTLKKIQFKGDLPKMEDLQRELDAHRWFELFVVSTLFPFVAAFTDPDLELEKIVESPEYRKRLYNNPDVIKEAKRLLPMYLGNLDIDSL